MELSVNDGVLRIDGGKETEIIINNIVSKVYNTKQEKVVLFLTDGTWNEIAFTSVTSPTFNLFSDMVAWFEEYVVPSGGTGEPQKSLNNRVAYVNYDMEDDDTDLMIFASYANAIAYITENEELSNVNSWTVVLPSGFCEEKITVYEYIAVSGQVNTYVDTLDTDIDFSGINYLSARVANIGIMYLEIAAGKALLLENCNIARATCESGSYAIMHSCHIWGGDYSGLTELSAITSSFITSLSDDIDLSGGGALINCMVMDYGSVTGKYIMPPKSANSCYIQLGDTKVSNIVKYSNCYIKLGDVEFDENTHIASCRISANSMLAAPDIKCNLTNVYIQTNDGFTADSAVINANNCYFDGDILLSGDAIFTSRNTQQSSTDTVYISETAVLNIYDGSRFDIIDISDSGASYDWRFQLIDNSETASESIAGKMRYREDANNSYLEQVMKTGASTWAWVVVKQNTW